MKAVAWAKRAAAPFVAVFDNPILLKELRAGMRGARYFATFMTILGIVSGILLTVFAVSGAGRDDPSLIGAGVFAVAFTLNIVVAFLVVPSFGATSITSERERQTYDILMSTTLTARQIVWGKLLASLAQVGAIFVSTIPVVGLTFLFGGITVRQMVAGYVTLVAISILLSAWAISVSASSQTSQRAVASSYVGAILVFVMLWGLGSFAVSGPLAYAFAETYGLTPDLRMIGAAPPVIPPWARALYVYILPAYLFITFVSLLLLNASARLKSPFDEKTPAFRIYFLAVTTVGLAIAYAIFKTDVAVSPAETRMLYLMVLGFLSFLTASVSCIFAAESVVQPLHVRERYAALAGWRRWRWILSPGSRPGAFFAVSAIIFLAGVSVILFLPDTHGFDQGSWSEYAAWTPLLRAVTVVIAWTVFLSGVAAWLTSVLPGRPRTIGVIAGLLLLAFCAIPIIHWSASTTVSPGFFQYTEITRLPGPFTLILSPVAGIWTSLSVHHDGIRSLPLDVSFLGAELPLHASQAVLFLGAGAILHLWAGRRRARLMERFA